MPGLTIFERTIKPDSSQLSLESLCGQIARGQQLLLAAAPAIATLQTFELELSIGASESHLVIRYDLVPKRQLPIFEVAVAQSKRRARDLALVDLQTIRSSILQRQEELDELASAVRQIGADAIARLTAGEQKLLLLLEKFAGERVELLFPDGEEQLHIPFIGELKEVEEPRRLRAFVLNCAGNHAVLTEPSVQETASHWMPIVNLRRGRLRLRWDATASEPQLKSIAEAAVLKRSLEMTVRLARAGTARQPIDAMLVTDDITDEFRA